MPDRYYHTDEWGRRSVVKLDPDRAKELGAVPVDKPAKAEAKPESKPVQVKRSEGSQGA